MDSSIALYETSVKRNFAGALDPAQGRPHRQTHDVPPESELPMRPTFIRAWRKHRRLTLKELSATVGVNSSTLSRIETGKIAYTQPVLESLAHALHCEPADLLMRDPKVASRDELSVVLDSLPSDKRAEALAILKVLTGRAA